MPDLEILSPSEQVARHLRRDLLRGRWSGTMPGVPSLAAELGVDAKTVWAATLLLEQEGLLAGQGAGRPRRIVPPKRRTEAPPLRVALLTFDSAAQGAAYALELRHLLEEKGHLPFFPGKTLLELRMEVGRVARFVRETTADAWVASAASREVLEWFAEQGTPSFALFGRRGGLPMAGAGPDKAPVFALLTRKLIALGHRRISFLCRRPPRLPRPGSSVRAFLGELGAAGIATGEFNLPDWEESREGFERVLDALFDHTAPTALILDEAFLYHAAHHHLGRRGLRVPQDVSLVCTDRDPTFAWCQPSVAHIRWRYRPVVGCVVRWAQNVARGRDDRRQTLTKAEFVEGGTIGPAP
ncbi:MAG: substrate-binding domain-containing protein [Akkermansiaceae bacterium]|nr:substrate-binding domain-containing protein [Akkermansiaceae bacterium]NNM28294.1 substrate-binding domain-containing protein [Akkermansiaceae bacterium]